MHYRNDWEYGSDEIGDLAFDFIAPLFARDENGVFVELREYFQHFWDVPEEEFIEQVARLLNSLIHQESIRIFRERDPYGRLFYRSLRYILHKHSELVREGSNGTQIVTTSIEKLFPVSPEILEEVFAEVARDNSNLTRQLETTLLQIIKEKNMAVPVNHLKIIATKHYRVLSEEIIQAADTADDSFLKQSIIQAIHYTQQKIDSSLLLKYERDHKLTSEERQAFRCAIKQLLVDFAVEDVEDNYFSYLETNLTSLEKMDEYRERYRTQFEYAVKKAKEIFSARLKNVFSI